MSPWSRCVDRISDVLRRLWTVYQAEGKEEEQWQLIKELAKQPNPLRYSILLSPSQAYATILTRLALKFDLPGDDEVEVTDLFDPYYLFEAPPSKR